MGSLNDEGSHGDTDFYSFLFCVLDPFISSSIDRTQTTAVSAARGIVELLQWKMVFKSPFWIRKLWKAEIWTEYSYDLVFGPIIFLVA